MENNPLKAGIIAENSMGVGSITPHMVRVRAAELALLDGRLSSESSKPYAAQARCELTGLSDKDPLDTVLEAAPESDRWDPVHGSTGKKVEVALGEDEDEEGRSDNERLVEAGVAEASLGQCLEATIAARERDL